MEIQEKNDSKLKREHGYEKMLKYETRKWTWNKNGTQNKRENGHEKHDTTNKRENGHEQMKIKHGNEKTQHEIMNIKNGNK